MKWARHNRGEVAGGRGHALCGREGAQDHSVEDTVDVYTNGHSNGQHTAARLWVEGRGQVIGMGGCGHGRVIGMGGCGHGRVIDMGECGRGRVIGMQR